MPFARIEFRDTRSFTLAPVTIDFERGDPIPPLGTYVSQGLIRGKVTDVSYDYDDSTIYIALS